MGLVIKSSIALFKIYSDQRVNTPHISCFLEMHLIEILTWSFVVLETSKRVHSIGN